MSLRARFGFRDDGTPQCRIVLPGADIDAATLAQIVFDADYAAVRLAYSGSVTYSGGAYVGMSTLLNFPDMGYVPFTLIAAYAGATGFGFYNTYVDAGSPASGPYRPYAQGNAIMAVSFMDEVPSAGSLNSVEATVTRTALTARSSFSFTGKLAYAIFAIPAG